VLTLDLPVSDHAIAAVFATAFVSCAGASSNPPPSEPVAQPGPPPPASAEQPQPQSPQPSTVQPTLATEPQTASSERDPRALTDTERVAYGMKVHQVLQTPGDICIRVERDGSQSLAFVPACRLLIVTPWVPSCYPVIQDCTAAFAKAVEDRRIERVEVTVSAAGEALSVEIRTPDIGTEQRARAEGAALCLLRAVPGAWLLARDGCR
jgi:hypothetical protein